MTTQNEVERIVYCCCREDIWIGCSEEIILEAKALDIPTCAPDARTVWYTIRCLCRLLVELRLIALQSLTEGDHKLAQAFILLTAEHFYQTGGEPPSAPDSFNNHLLMSEHEIEILSLTCSEIEFDCCLNLDCLEPSCSLGLLIDITSNLKALTTEIVVETFQHTRGACQLSHRRKSTHGVILSEDPTIVGIARFSVRHCRSITQQHILAYCVTDDTTIEAPQSLIRTHYGEGTILYLLQQVVTPIRLMDFNGMFLLINCRNIDLRVECLIGQRKDIRLANLRLDAQVKITSIMPSSDIDTRNDIALSIF